MSGSVWQRFCGVPEVWCRCWCLGNQTKPTPNGARLPIHKERRPAAGKYSSICWHTHRLGLNETGRTQTTMNVYGRQ